MIDDALEMRWVNPHARCSNGYRRAKRHGFPMLSVLRQNPVVTHLLCLTPPLRVPFT
jgi:hypothetical protein